MSEVVNPAISVRAVATETSDPRRILAFRDFPPGCGRKAPHLSKIECLELIASSKLSRGSSGEDRPREEYMHSDFSTERRKFFDKDGIERTKKAKASIESGEEIPVKWEKERSLKQRDREKIPIRTLFHPKFPSFTDKVGRCGESSGVNSNEASRSVSWAQKRPALKSQVPSTHGSLISRAKRNEVTVRSNSTYIPKQTEILMGGSSRMDIQPAPISINDGSKYRNRVKEILRKFDEIFSDVSRKEERKSKDQVVSKRIDLVSLKIIKAKGICPNVSREAILGNVPGVEVGDKFQYRVELHIIELHRPLQSGIDSIRRGNGVLASSIVASGGYVDYAMDNGEVLQYSGQGGNLFAKDKCPEDQKLVVGNLALKNSMDERRPVRVIRGFKDTMDSKGRMVYTFSYDGLYRVEKYCQQKGPYGNKIFMFTLRRIPGQPPLRRKRMRNLIN